MIAQFCRFGTVGVLATLVHLALSLLLFRSGVALHIANALAFFCAFSISFIAHFWFTFAVKSASILKALLRYFIVAVTGYALNGGVLIAAEATGKISAEPALILAVGLAAILSFFLSRSWAF